MANQVNTEELKENISRRSTWMRLLYMILFAVIFGIAEFIVAAVVVIQFGFVLLSGKANEDLREFGDSLSRYVYDMLRFLTFNSEALVFPFTEWSYGGASAGTASSTAARPRSAGTKKKAAGKKPARKKTSPKS